MSKRILITFSGSAYDETTRLTVENAPKLGADQVIVYDDRWLMDQEFWDLNKWLWNRRDDHGQEGRGFLWFSWKPFVVMDAMSRMADGDLVMYVDADTYPIASLEPFYAECVRNGGMMLFNAVGCMNNFYTKRDCLIVMGQDEERYRTAQHAVARFMVFQKGPWKVQQFLSEWLTYCLNPLAQTFDPSALAPEHPDLIQHRTEQSVFTNLAHKYGQRLYREACQFGATQPQDQDIYPQSFIQVGTGKQKTLKGSAYRNA